MRQFYLTTKLLPLWLTLFSTVASLNTLLAQETIIDTTTRPAVKSDSLPFFIHPSKRMSDEELEDKKEGTFITGLPNFKFDPIRGFGAGANVYLTFNGKKSDPFFAWTPYRHRISADFVLVANGTYRASLNYDVPYIFNKKWRMRANLVWNNDPEAQYWGIGNYTLGSMSFYDKSKGRYDNKRTFTKFKDYEENLALAVRQDDGSYVTDIDYHTFYHREQLYNVLIERVALGGRLRWMFGFELNLTRFTDFSYRKPVDNVADFEGNDVVEVHNGQSLIRTESQGETWKRLNIGGFNDKWQVNPIGAFAVIYDTRDFEPDPSKGIFAEFSYENSMGWLGGAFNMHKYMVQVNGCITPLHWRKKQSRLTFAGLLAFGHIFGPKVNFVELFDLSSQAEAGGTSIMGGERSLRGFRENRFMAPMVILNNVEARIRFYEFKILKQHIALGINVFHDAGTVAEKINDFRLTGLRSSPGIGFRIAWNQSTILRGDWGFSSEQSQFFFGFGHIF
jgi:hypothetical protein